MKPKDEKRIAAQLSKSLAMVCFRNVLEPYHLGTAPITQTGDYTDVKVTDASGRELSWHEVSKIDDEQMKEIVKAAVNRLYTWFLMADDLSGNEHLQRWITAAQRYDEPELDQGMMNLSKR